MNGRLTTAFAFAVLGVVAILIVPLPPPVLDALLALNVFGSALVLLISLRVEEPLEFSAFAPSLLLATLFRLSLDVSATRLILTQGHDPGGVGALIPAFGQFVVRGNIVVGLIVFAILIVIQFVVIASGAQRVAEVCARFTLDAMPGKQMAIDADLHAGMLDAEAARRKRKRVEREADFYAAMDGAGKFVKGDAIAALVIVVLNLLGGIVVGVAYHGMSPLDAIQTFAILSIGNALLTTLPAFLISTAMGLMVTRVAGDGALGVDLAAQLLARPDVLRVAGALVFTLAFIPSFPGPLFGTLGITAFLGAALAHRAQQRTASEAHARDVRRKRDAVRRPENAFALVGVEALAIDVGAELYALLAPPNCDALLDRIGDVRRALAAEIGLVIPGVRLRDDPLRDPGTYGIRVRDREVASGAVRLDRLVAVGDAAALQRIGGEETREPVYGLAGRWIAIDERARAQAAGALAFDAISIVGSHLAEVVRAQAADLFGRQEFHTLIEHLRTTVPAVVKDVGTDVLPATAAHRAMTLLLREGVWPRDPVAVLEAFCDAAAGSREPRELAEAARRAIVPQQLRRDGVTGLKPLIVEPAFEAELARMWGPDGGLAPDPRTALHVRDAVARYVADATLAPHALVVTGGLRPLLAEFLDRMSARLAVYSYAELPPELALEPSSVLSAAF
ncbi:flagellar biosynthesis protein FlhA [Vulcanimicrobium alpinum]|uniref:Flagellar biosynthesis protein FlhA n=1 Tax=Vulcanimicrobium alpinum TaxID=3016050 RepID=A0AAN1XY90_UNVUL|nr:flagellar biosynthesis protein FlhA [Vulcanimicrobium alpinum]BDE07564.1 flagellar biosynthesis protein FlhA [Vulcanimicrobium alpinum]